MPFELFEFLERLMIGAFLIILTQLEKNRSTGNRWKSKNGIPLSKLEIVRFFAPFPRSYL